MGDYLRVTKECTPDSLHPALAGAIRDHIEKHEPEDIFSSVLFCCETTSTRKKKRLLAGKPVVILTGILLTPQWLIWAAGKENETPGVISARLRDIQIQDYEKSELYKLIQDTGLSISGLRMDAVVLGSAFIGLGTEPAAQTFREKLKDAIAKA
jgi:hypothetical protein